jgi:hypothetical protein
LPPPAAAAAPISAGNISLPPAAKQSDIRPARGQDLLTVQAHKVAAPTDPAQPQKRSLTPQLVDRRPGLLLGGLDLRPRDGLQPAAIEHAR